MKALQAAIHQPKPDPKQIGDAIKDMEGKCEPNRIDQELIASFFLRYDLFPILVPFLHTKQVKYWELPHQDPLLIYYLQKYDLISLSDAQKFNFFNKYHQIEDGKEVPKDYEEQREIHFGGSLALAIAKDDIVSLQELSMVDNFNWNLSLNIEDLRFPYVKIPLLHYAAQNGSINCFKFLLVNGASVTEKIAGSDWDVISFAGVSGSIEMVRILEQMGCEIPNNLATAAAKFHHNEILEWLKDSRGCDFIKLNKALISAAQYNNIEGMEIAINAGADLSVYDDSRKTIIHYVAHFNTIEIAELLIQRTPHFEDTDLKGFTFLHEAAINNSKEVAELFLPYITNYETNDSSGYSPLYQAAFHNSVDMIGFLLDHGANINIEGKYSVTPLHGAAKTNSVEALELLINRGAKMDCRDAYQQLPIHFAGKRNAAKAIELLLNKGCDINSVDDRNRTPLIIAAERNSLDAARILIEKGADINLQESTGRTPLLVAAEKNYEDFVALLLEKGADPNIQNDSKDTPLHRAVAVNSYKIAKMLLESGAKINIVGAYGRTPMQKAMAGECSEILELLKTYTQ